MNERVMIVGQDAGGCHYFAHWANDETIFSGKTIEEAINNLLAERYPHIWHLNDTEPFAHAEILSKTPQLGQCSQYVNRLTGEVIPPIVPVKDER